MRTLKWVGCGLTLGLLLIVSSASAGGAKIPPDVSADIKKRFPKATIVNAFSEPGNHVEVNLRIGKGPTFSVVYKGKTVNLIIPNAPGGSFDLYARLAASHLGRFMPGNPSIVAQNMPGAAGMQAANYLAAIAPKDGTTLSVLVPNITLAQILGVQSIAYDTRRLNWIGRIIATTATLFTWHRSGTKTLADLTGRETLVASTGQPRCMQRLEKTMNIASDASQFVLVFFEPV